MSSNSAAVIQKSPDALQADEQTCPLCQTVFDPACAVSGCGGCPLTAGCAALSCPSCGYSFPRPTGLSAWLQRVLKRKERKTTATAGQLTLCDLPSGQRARVTGMASGHTERLSKLAAFGIVEGSELRVRQRRPTFVIDLGETTLALDAEIAETIQVAPLDG